jgi:hypothetical protein
MALAGPRVATRLTRCSTMYGCISGYSKQSLPCRFESIAVGGVVASRGGGFKLATQGHLGARQSGAGKDPWQRRSMHAKMLVLKACSCYAQLGRPSTRGNLPLELPAAACRVQQGPTALRACIGAACGSLYY